MTIPPSFRLNQRSGCQVFRAPARINIIGEHTDYNDGLVLPTNSALFTWLAISPRTDRTVRVYSQNMDETCEFSLDDDRRPSSPAWQDYVRGVCVDAENAGYPLQGADIEISGDIPLGNGLSSSASLEVAVATAMLQVALHKTDAEEIAKICQRAEINFAGVNCGIMDQFSIACNRFNEAILLDCRTLESRFAQLPDNLGLLVTDSGTRHQLSDGNYNNRRDECQAALTTCRTIAPAATALRDLSVDSLDRLETQLDNRLFRRVRHVASEIERTKAAFAALLEGDIETLGRLVTLSHASLRDDYDVSCDAIEDLVATLGDCDGVLGSRMVGGGFGGCVLSVLHRADIESVQRQVAAAYTLNGASVPWMHVVKATEAAGQWDES